MGNDTGCENLTGELVPLEEFDYTNEKVGCILRQGFAEVNFLGNYCELLCFSFQSIIQTISKSINYCKIIPSVP